MFNFFLYLLISLYIFVCLLLMMIVLIQKGRGGGLASAFGGGGGNTAFGSKTGDVLTWATSVIFGIFLLLAVVLNLMVNRAPTRISATTPAQTTQNGTPGAPVNPPAPPADVPIEK